MPVSSRRRLTVVVTVAVTALAATTGSAMASGPSSTCPPAALTNPFVPWADSADYQIAPGGSVEGAAAGWSLTGGAGAVEGNETFMVGSASDHRAMRLPAASSAMTARMCVSVDHPTFRFFAKRSGGPALSRLLVEVLFNDPSGHQRTIPVVALGGSDSWAPSPILLTLANVTVPLTGNTVDVSFRFKPQGAGAVWSIDDVYVDPTRGT